ncbi:Nif3-like dinuclear metal center hexameric protein [Oleiphilus sp. HI0009]|uniref:Nif3-like dinuclear metal center hexameric protein n=2 Tax=Oleiphilus TaxID=141450 RepID=UPI0007C39A3D|nr:MULTISPECIES: Nif3-like dinuclear metal center hexameric protein [unclassified Oleiphilus]KZX78566.1 Nif3-like dinuclear metal center hexameric protein [Oleiphilus sp. HI0009]KZX82617.1 Nif3-like dinuclear metal center hexameric protein [Oleiphilus sp. HI0009]KZY65465.1 Nif3-like dinuclear metal center hexameric protein [Oleiphilus sp. HI0066]KZY65774.1 Nif3-like dinuclear metal center hexameric protein [Oleiphilus sp. HI0066]KZY69190.1 Nif3-like dinuclear metal center hexameric protein [Ol
MIERIELEKYLADLLSISSIRDYCPNGLQVEGASQISKIVGGVTASQDLIDVAIKENADAILVHHGYFWKGESEAITGIKRNRIKALLDHDINLFAYHLPLDVHPTLGNNAELGRLLGFETSGGMEPDNKFSVGLVGSLPTPMVLSDLTKHVSAVLGRDALSIGASDKEIKTVAWCTGGAQSMIDKAVALGVDAYISGEISEPTVHIARETGVAYISAGHHATERYGAKALGEYLQDKFDLDFVFVDIDNPV